MLVELNKSANNDELPAWVQSWAKYLHIAMLDRVSSQFCRPASLIATLLDPRFKRLATIPLEMRVMAHHYLRAAAVAETELMPDVDAAPIRRVPVVPDVDRLADVPFFPNFDNEDHSDYGSSDYEAGEAAVDRELRIYKALPNLETRTRQPDMTQNPLPWWKNNEKKLPILSRLARKYLAIPSASAAVERLFSYTGNRVGKKNANLGDETLLSMMLVRGLSKFVDMYEPRYPAPVQ